MTSLCKQYLNIDMPVLKVSRLHVKQIGAVKTSTTFFS